MATEQEARAARFSESARLYAQHGWTLVRLNGKTPKARAWQTAEFAEPGAAAGQWSVYGRSCGMGVHLGASGLEVVEQDTAEGLTTLLEQGTGLLTRSHLCELGIPRAGIDAIFRKLDVIVYPGYTRPMIRVEDFLQLTADCTYGRDRIRP